MRERFSILDKHLLLDTGVVKNLFKYKKSRFETDFWDSVSALSYTKNSCPYFISTPLMSVEFLGYNINKFDPILVDREMLLKVQAKLSQFKADTVYSGLADIADQYVAWLKRHPDLNLTTLVARTQQEAEYRSPWARGLFEHLIGGRFEKSSEYESLLRAIAFDRIQSIAFEDYISQGEILKIVDVAFLSLSISEMFGDRTMAPCRFVDKILCRAAKSLGQDSVSGMYCNEGQTLDTELVYFSIVGHKSRELDRLKSVSIFSTERIESWHSRIEAFVKALEFMNDSIRDWAKSIVIRPGLIFRVCQETATVIDVLDVYRKIRLSGLNCEQDNQFRVSS